MKKVLLAFGLITICVFAYAQNGMENLIVEKYYIANAADSAGSIGALSKGSVTYRLYVDMLPGYKFEMAYGNGNHPLTLQTSTAFFNNEDRGATTPTYTKTQASHNTVMLDSWLSVGAACAGNFGVLKTDDDGANNVVNINGILANTDVGMGIPLTTQDGLMAGTPEQVTFVGINPATDLTMLDAISLTGNLLTTSDGAWASLNGSVGPTAANRVLIAQITTDGIFHYDLNIQIGTPSGGIENYVYSNPVMFNGQMEIAMPALSGSPNVAPIVSISGPANNEHAITGDIVPLTASATDIDGTVKHVQFFVDGTSAGIDSIAPYSVNYTSVTGTHIITAVATDNGGLQKTSDPVTLIVAPNQPPTVSISSPVNGASVVEGTLVNITASALDADGTVASVEFFVDGVFVGIDNTAPYAATYTGVLGSHLLTAQATDNRGSQTNSASVALNVVSSIGIPNIENEQYLHIYPNPASANASIDFTLAQDENVKIDILDMTGRNIMTVQNSSFDAGRHNITFDVSDLSDGAWFIKITTPAGTTIKKLIVLK